SPARPSDTVAVLRSSIDLAHHDVDRSHDGRDVGQKYVPAHFGNDREIHKAWPADVHAIRNRPALAFDVKAKMAARVFILGVDFACGDFHRARQFRAERAIRHLLDALPQDLHTLFHLLHLDPVTVPAIAERAA